jgi:hypothetical protein
MSMLLDLLLVLVLLAALAGIVMALTRRRRLAYDRWRVRVRAIQGGTAVEIIRPGDQPMRVALLDPADEDFSMKLEEARAAAVERTITLNSVHESLLP